MGEKRGYVPKGSHYTATQKEGTKGPEEMTHISENPSGRERGKVRGEMRSNTIKSEMGPQQIKVFCVQGERDEQGGTEREQTNGIENLVQNK